MVLSQDELKRQQNIAPNKEMTATFETNPDYQPPEINWRKQLIWLIIAVLVGGTLIAYYLADWQKQGDETLIPKESAIEEPLMHELTEQEFQTILANIFIVQDGKYVVDENNNPIRRVDYAYILLEQKINELNIGE